MTVVLSHVLWVATQMIQSGYSYLWIGEEMRSTLKGDTQFVRKKHCVRYFTLTNPFLLHI